MEVIIPPEGQGSGLVNHSLREVALQLHVASKVLAASVGVTNVASLSYARWIARRSLG